MLSVLDRYRTILILFIISVLIIAILVLTMRHNPVKIPMRGIFV